MRKDLVPIICLDVYLLPNGGVRLGRPPARLHSLTLFGKPRPNFDSYEIGQGGPNESESSLVDNDLMLIVCGYFCKTDLYR